MQLTIQQLPGGFPQSDHAQHPLCSYGRQFYLIHERIFTVVNLPIHVREAEILHTGVCRNGFFLPIQFVVGDFRLCDGGMDAADRFFQLLRKVCALDGFDRSFLLAESVLAEGGDVTGVEPQFFVDEELQLDGLTELIVTRDMTERKNKMIELGDAFIAFPGGTGTLEEIAEVMSKVSLNQLNAPCILYNLNGYYDSLQQLLLQMIEKGLSTRERQNGISFAADLAQIQQILSPYL